jgi:16S rRNA (adenine1518-N6/adenine1519-N6)-dimethyltransferase
MRNPSDTRRPRARKRFGQHFLEPAWAQKVVHAIDPKPDQVFVEIGPGPGAITRPLASAVRALVACEIDRDLAASLRQADLPNVTVLEGDFLAATPQVVRAALGAAADGPIRVAGNLPYNVASPIMFHLVALHRGGLPIEDATLMLQREVADRLLAAPGSGEYGTLTVLIGHRARVDRLLNLPPGAFRPMPKVQSTVVRLRFHAPDPPVRDETVLAGVVGALFTRRRKTLGNALLAYGALTPESSREALARADIAPARRPETLSIGEMARLADVVAAIAAGPAKAGRDS